MKSQCNLSLSPLSLRGGWRTCLTRPSWQLWNLLRLNPRNAVSCYKGRRSGRGAGLRIGELVTNKRSRSTAWKRTERVKRKEMKWHRDSNTFMHCAFLICIEKWRGERFGLSSKEYKWGRNQQNFHLVSFSRYTLEICSVYPNITSVGRALLPACHVAFVPSLNEINTLGKHLIDIVFFCCYFEEGGGEHKISFHSRPG